MQDKLDRLVVSTWYVPCAQINFGGYRVRQWCSARRGDTLFSHDLIAMPDTKSSAVKSLLDGVGWFFFVVAGIAFWFGWAGYPRVCQHRACARRDGGYRHRSLVWWIRSHSEVICRPF